MTDLYLTIAEQPQSVIDAIADSMDKRAAEPEMQAICHAYMDRLPRTGIELLELGCGNGATTAMLLDRLRPSRYVGVDPSDGLLARARTRYAGRDDVSFISGDVTRSGQPDASVNLVVAHTVYSHIPDPQAALAEAWRVLRPGGVLAIFDGDYATNTVALHDGDPLQSAMRAALRHLIHDPYIMRRICAMAVAEGFAEPTLDSYSYVRTGRADYMETVIARGVDAATATGEIGQDHADAFKRECAARVASGRFYGAILSLSLIVRKPE